MCSSKRLRVRFVKAVVSARAIAIRDTEPGEDAVNELIRARYLQHDAGGAGPPPNT